MLDGKSKKVSKRCGPQGTPREPFPIYSIYALSGPRLIVVSYTTATGDNKRVFVDIPPLPSCLFTCRESREVALEKYEKCTLTSLSGSPISFINFTSDQFLLGGPDANLDIDYLMSIIAPDTSHKIRFLHVSRGCWNPGLVL